MTIKLDYQSLKPHLSDNLLVLTPNSRTQKAVYAARMSELAEGQVDAGLTVKSMSQLVDELWSELSFVIPLPKRISAFVLKVWLEKQIESESEWTLTNPAGVAGKVVDAYQNLVHWRLDVNQLEQGESTEIDFFIQWISDYQALAKDKGLLAEFSVLQFIIDHISLLENKIPKLILMVGFNQLTPLESFFLEQLQQLGIQVNHYQPKIKPQLAQQFVFDSLDEELEFAAHYAQQKQAQGKAVAIVVDQLANHLPQVHHQFSRVFQPNEELPWVELNKPEYNVSAGFPLSDQPVVKAALTLLGFQSRGLKQQEVHFLKNSPFIDWGEHADKIRYFIHQICLQPRKQYSIDFLIRRIDSAPNQKQLALLKRRLQVTSDLSMGKKTSDKLVEMIKQYLNTWGWILSSDNDSAFETQAKQSFQSAINACRRLSDFHDKINYRETIDFLKQQLLQQTFQIASDRVNVHVLGVLEASGLQFDELVLVGFTRDTWPQKNKINPFLPLEWQREHLMPGSSAEREYQYAADLSESLLSASENLLVTSTRSEGEKKNNVSQFFAHLEEAQPESLVQLANDEKLEPDFKWVTDDQINLSEHTIKGGAYLLSDYAKCPFMAMAKYQMRLTGYEPVDVGVEPRSKGTWLHDTMELIWQSLHTQQALCETRSDELEELVDVSLHTALEKAKDYLLSITENEIVDLEYQKLKKLIMQWLAIEKTRSQFEVAELESDYSLALGELRLNFRIDRLDKVMNNRLEIIDYKTGSTATNNWFGVRPTEAQMPAYVLALQEAAIHGLNYARIKTGEVAQSGLVFCNESPQINTFELTEFGEKVSVDKARKELSFEQLKQQWRASLHRLADGIVSGFAPVAPKEPNKTCMYCDFSAVCRIAEEQPNV
jgi:ATP-dependent helicase/nuclease subunit B